MYNSESPAPPPLPPTPPTPLFTSTAPPPVPAASSSGTVFIPTKNPPALTAYYLAVFSLIPVLGFVLGCIALPLGIKGLKKYKQNPQVRGATHAWVGIIVGGGVVVLHLFVIAMLIFNR